MTATDATTPWASRGAQALATLHARELRRFVDVWRRADAAELALPETDDPSYASRETLLVHVAACAAGYLVWIQEQRGLAPPDLDRRPDPEGFGRRVDGYVDEVLAAWDVHLRDLTEADSDRPAYETRWGVPYCIDAMLEHAVMHPLRHRHQLERLLGEDAGG